MQLRGQRARAMPACRCCAKDLLHLYSGGRSHGAVLDVGPTGLLAVAIETVRDGQLIAILVCCCKQSASLSAESLRRCSCEMDGVL